MTTFIALVLVVLALHAVFVAATRLGGRPATRAPYRYNFFRGNTFAGAAEHVDRDAERAFADLAAMSMRGPHN